MKKAYSFLSILLVSVNLNAQTGSNHFIGSCDNDMLSEMVMHGTYIYGIGTTNSFGASAGDVYLFKSDTSGHTLWARQVGTGEDMDQGVSLKINDLNQIIITARVPHENGSILLSRFDTSGTLIQSSVLNDEGQSILATAAKADNGILLCGMQLITGHYLPSLVSTDASGNILWAKTLSSIPATDSSGGNGIGTGVLALPDGSVMLTGSIQSGTLAYPFAAKLDASGNLLWFQTYNMQSMDGYGNIVATTDGNFMLCGSTLRVSDDGADPFVIKIDPDGAPLFSYVYRLDQAAGVLTSLPRVKIMVQNDHYLLSGTASTNTLGDASDYYALYLDEFGNIDWAKKYGNSTTNVCVGAIATTDGLIMGGYSEENADGNAIVGHAQRDILLVKTGLDGISSLNTIDLVINRSAFVNDTIGNPVSLNDYLYASTISGPTVSNVAGTYDSASCFGLSVPQTALAETNMQLYPNPAVAYTEITVSNAITVFDLYVHNTAGELVFSQSNIQNGKMLLGVNDFAPGIYIVTARSGKVFIGSHKLVVQ